MVGVKNGIGEKIARSRHETVNKRLKQFGILKNVYRHKLNKHQVVFSAVAVIVQLEIQNGMPLFHVKY